MSSFASLIDMDRSIKLREKKDSNIKSNMGKNNTHGKTDENASYKNTPRNTYRNNAPGNSKKGNKEKKKIDYDEPDRSFGDLYCVICDSHMNADAMWVSHIQGRRHQRNKKRGAPENKYEEVSDMPTVLSLLNETKDVIVGLNYICEILRDEQDPTYQCFLCSANLPSGNQLIDHLICTKHRVAFLKENDPESYEKMQQLDLRKGSLEPVAEENCALFEQKYGRGKLQVKREKPREAEEWYDKSHQKGKYERGEFSKSVKRPVSPYDQRNKYEDYQHVPKKRHFPETSATFGPSLSPDSYDEYPPARKRNRSGSYEKRSKDVDEDSYLYSRRSSPPRMSDYDLRDVLNQKSRMASDSSVAPVKPIATTKDCFNYLQSMTNQGFLDLVELRLDSSVWTTHADLRALKETATKMGDMINNYVKDLQVPNNNNSNAEMIVQNKLLPPSFLPTNNAVTQLSPQAPRPVNIWTDVLNRSGSSISQKTAIPGLSLYDTPSRPSAQVESSFQTPTQSVQGQTSESPAQAFLQYLIEAVKPRRPQ